MPEIKTDILVIGAGIAGVSVAAECAAHADVLVVERESYPGTHATGRSAAFFAPAYGNDVVRAISVASDAFFRNPPGDTFIQQLLKPRNSVFIAASGQEARLQEMAAEIPALTAMSCQELLAQIPIMNSGYLAAALIDQSGGDLDVDAIMQGYLRLLRSKGGQLVTNTPIEELRYGDGLWHAYSGDRIFSAPVIVNAGGAWADSIAISANVGSLGIEPFRRTALLVDLSADVDASEWPLVVDVDEQFYFKPDAGLLLLSPADETPSEPGDAYAEDWDIAVAVDRVSQVLDLEVQRIKHSWAGLRSFAADRTFVVGEDPRAKGFYWLAGQGGYGVQSAPALARLAAHQLTGSSLSTSDLHLLQLVERISPNRFIDGSGAPSSKLKI